MIDRTYCSSSFLMYRYIVDIGKVFSNKYPPRISELPQERISIQNSENLYAALKSQVDEATMDGKAALALSGGIDSAILAKMMPKGSTAYTFKCVVPGVKVVDETEIAAQYADACGLNHKVIEIFWKDVEEYAPLLMKHKGAPIHSIETQIYKASLQAKADGFERLIYGEAADSVFGGLSGLLSQDWNFGEFLERYIFVKPWKVLKEFKIILNPMFRHVKNGYIDPHEFISTEFYKESINSYINASNAANIGVIMPYANCKMDCVIDYNRVRSGENKYLVREVFKKLYPGFEIPPKTPMPRPTNEWFKNWSGPNRAEFWPHCTDNMTGDQKWLVYSLEKFLDIIDE